MVELALAPPPAEAVAAPLGGAVPGVNLLVPAGFIVAFTLMSYAIYISLSQTRRAKRALGMACILAAAFSLAPPVNAIAYGSPLTTTNIGLFCYYNEATGFDLANVTTAFQTYTNHGTYIDGTVRVYQAGTGNTYVHDAQYCTVSVRVRTDGWIMAFCNTTQEERYPYYGKDTADIPVTMTDYWTSLGRAINRVYYVASKVFPGYSALGYYDYSQPTATKLLFVQMNVNESWLTLVTRDVYVSVPNTETILKTRVASFGQHIGGTATWNGGALTLGNPGYTKNTVTLVAGAVSTLEAYSGINNGNTITYEFVIMVWLV